MEVAWVRERRNRHDNREALAQVRSLRRSASKAERLARCVSLSDEAVLGGAGIVCPTFFS